MRTVKILVSTSVQADQNLHRAYFGLPTRQFLDMDICGLTDCAAVQADLSLHWAHLSEGTFSHPVAQIIFTCLINLPIDVWY